ncbi:hypothetical protein [Haloarchaeobius sp. HME9146]|uniref:hypothetical protein n=1 Tax=Haloarchaeobius sp. HME9146 TaxID=2978732 RepID=UPI0021BF4301|nr:hypothetical protein [Haloarchaeobius sp. HME9146]MCT9097105.1 hypothetical protein [Haloarchaeobius sp. HME9146]
MKRRALLGAVSAAVTTGLAGCSGVLGPGTRTREPFTVDLLPTTDEPTTGEPTTTEDSFPAIPEAMVEFQNRSGEDREVTVSVHRNDVLVGWESRTVSDGGYLWVGPLSAIGDYGISLDVAQAPTENRRWTVERTWAVDLDSHKLRLALWPGDELEATEVLRCQPDCRAMRGRAIAHPVDTGEGEVMFTRAALRNESSAATELKLHVAYGGQAVFDGLYVVPPGSEIWIPDPVVTAGTYSVAAGTADGQDRHFWWHVGGDRANLAVVVDDSSRLLVGCSRVASLGKRRVQLFVENKDEVPRTVDLSLTNEYVQGATGSVTVDPGSWSPLSVAVPIGGSFEATITVGEHTETVTWNTCPYSGGGIWLSVKDGEPVILREN